MRQDSEFEWISDERKEVIVMFDKENRDEIREIKKMRTGDYFIKMLMV